MRISTKGRYALRVMADLARQNPNVYVSLAAIAQRQDISVKYLEAIVAKLHQAGFVASQRGKNGGYRLARPAATYTAGSVLKLVEGNLAPVACLDDDAVLCARSGQCETLPLWLELDRLVDRYLESVTLADLLAWPKADGETAISR
ncbi:MAG: Rrf2 family transcriptional regulator [Clostridiaceae bacterium]|jgi:Rrf2 family protein|nr:Rrf2 family transcriptional regulator [Clostridiaceae bacterium]